jgi:hypothetical protein
MAIEKIVLIFALLGSALYVFEKAVAIIAAAIGRVKAVAPANPAPATKQEPKLEQQQLIPAQSRDQIARMLGLLESLTIANEEMKDNQAELLQRIATLESAQAAPKETALKETAPKRARAKKATGLGTSLEEGLIAAGFTHRSEEDRGFEVIS